MCLRTLERYNPAKLNVPITGTKRC